MSTKTEIKAYRAARSARHAAVRDGMRAVSLATVHEFGIVTVSLVSGNLMQKRFHGPDAARVPDTFRDENAEGRSRMVRVALESLVRSGDIDKLADGPITTYAVPL